VERRWIELIEPGVPAAPIHHEDQRLDLATTVALVIGVIAPWTRGSLTGVP
jgi:hypothetical protein